MIEVKDQFGGTFHFERVPERIVSLVPSQTEFLYDLGLDKEVVGITKFCVHPEFWYSSKLRVGGTKNVNIETVRSLEPDLIIANKEENTKDDIELLRTIAPVWISDVVTYNDALEMMSILGSLTGKEEQAEVIIEKTEQGFASIRSGKKGFNKSVLYCIWHQPLMAAGRDTFIDSMLGQCGLKNCVDDARYPEISPDMVDPDYIFLSSEPFHFNDIHKGQIQNQFPHAHIIRVDGEAFSWYGSRMLKSSAYFDELLSELS